MSTVSYDGAKTVINESTCAAFIAAEVTGDLLDVPGVGPAAVQAFEIAGVGNTFALLGQFMMLRREGMTGQEHQNAMARYLKKIGINALRNDVVYSCSNKLQSHFSKLSENDDAGKNDVLGGGASMNQDVFEGMQTANTAFKQVNAKMDMDKVDDARDDLEDALDMQNEIGGATSGASDGSNLSILLLVGFLVLVAFYMMSGGNKTIGAPDEL